MSAVLPVSSGEGGAPPPAAPAKPTPVIRPSPVSAVYALVLVVAMVVLMTVTASNRAYVWTWAVALGGLVVASAAIGRSVTGRLLGVLVDDRNLMSLSRFQFVCWTLLVLSGFAAAAWARVQANVPDALAIAIDPRLWVLMGISTTSLVGSPLILNDKRIQQADPDAVERSKAIAESQGVAREEVSNQGRLFTNVSPKSAAWSDLVTGEELGNAFHVDLSRLQMLFFTVVVLLAYAADMLRFFMSVAPADMGQSFPALHESMVALIGISHGGYLAAKAAKKP